MPTRILRTFRPPWRIVRRKGGGIWVESKDGRVLLYVYPRLNQNTDYTKPDEAEAFDIWVNNGAQPKSVKSVSLVNSEA
jgi:hypothetical protein